MNNEFEYIIKAVKNIKLSENERAEMRASLLENFAPSKIEEYQNITGFRNTRLYYFLTGGYRYKFAPALMMILVVVLSGGASAFAEKAIPGDFLYKVKILVNEPVAGAFSFSKEKKVEWQGKLVERRLGEAQKLVSRGNFNKTTRVNLENQIKNEIDEFNVNVNKLALEKNEGTNSSDLNIKLQASFKAHQNILEKLSFETDIKENTKQETEKFLTTLEGYKNKVKDDHKNLELDVGVDASVAENSLNSIKLEYEKEKINLSANIQNQINDKLVLAEIALQDGKAFLISSDYAKATDKFQLVISLTNKGKLLIFSNVIKDDIENDMGIEENNNDVEDDQFEDINLGGYDIENDQLENTEEGDTNSSEFDQIN